MKKETRFIEHNDHVDIEEYYPLQDIWAVIRCSAILSKKVLKYSGTEKEKSSKAVMEHYYRNRERILENRKKNHHKKYGLTKEKFNTMKVEQSGKCFICGQEKKLVIDHDHRSGLVRKLLCTKCNVGIGLLQDSPELLQKASLYIKSFFDGKS